MMRLAMVLAMLPLFVAASHDIFIFDVEEESYFYSVNATASFQQRL